MKHPRTFFLWMVLFFAALAALPSIAAPKKKPPQVSDGSKELTQEQKTQFNDLIDKATKNFKAQYYEEALSNYKDAYDIDADPDLLLAIAQCYRKLTFYEKAISSYNQYLHDKPNSPDRASIEDLIKTSKELLVQGVIEFSSDQDPAQLSLDNVPQGTTPITITGLKPGEYKIEVTKEGFKPYPKVVKLAPSQRLTLGASLEALPGSFDITSAQDPLGVYLDGVLVGPSPKKFQTTAGPHQLRFTKDNFQASSLPIVVAPGESIVLSPVLEPGKGNLQIKTNLKRASILLDGKGKGRTKNDGSFDLTGIPAGSHSVKIILPPFQDTTQTIIIKDEETFVIDSYFTNPPLPKILYSASGVSLMTGLVLRGIAEGILDAELIDADVSKVGTAFFGTAVVSGGAATYLKLRQRAKTIAQNREIRKEKRKQEKEDQRKLKDDKDRIKEEERKLKKEGEDTKEEEGTPI